MTQGGCLELSHFYHTWADVDDIPENPCAAGTLCDMLPLLLAGAGAAEEEGAPARAEPEPGLLSGNGGLGTLVNSTKDFDPNAQLLAQKLAGRAQVEFLNLKDVEFDTVSDDYVASAKPGNFQIDRRFRKSAKRMYEVSAASGRTPYFQFDSEPSRDVMNASNGTIRDMECRRSLISVRWPISEPCTGE
ncbi:restriction endonuclease fold toxin [Streptomyces sp. NPDC054804]